jgi:light-regulated signal transduction histidine kinase (bacteriophytochrome)
MRADLEAGEVKIGDCLCGHVAQTGTPLILWDNASDSMYASREALRAEGLRFHAAFPLNVKNQVIGVLCLFAHGEARPSQRHLDLVQQLCGPIALAIDNARLYEQSQLHAAELEQRVAERTVQLAAINQELEAFSYSVAHDLRVPLRAIDGYSQLLLEDAADRLDVDDRHHLERIRAATQRMHQLIDDLLELSRLSRGDLERIPLDLSALAQAVAADLRRRSPGRQVEFVVAPGVMVRADAELMRAVLENLLGNAWKFTSKAPAARIEFGEMRELRDGQEERIYFVRDNGVGFDTAQADKLFHAFQRLHAQDDFPGTGIGLATVRRVIHRHGGRVWAQGVEGQGATFYFTL